MRGTLTQNVRLSKSVQKGVMLGVASCRVSKNSGMDSKSAPFGVQKIASEVVTFFHHIFLLVRKDIFVVLLEPKCSLSLQTALVSVTCPRSRCSLLHVV